LCWISKGVSKDIPLDHIKQAYRAKNKHGFGIMWHDGQSAQEFTTLSYKAFRRKMQELADIEVAIHLRYATRGAENLANCHPFKVGDGYMMHNGTISGFGTTTYTTKYSCADSCSSTSDTSDFAEMLSKCKYEHITDISPIIQHLIGATINRLVFIDADGQFTIFNKHLGITEGDIWYSNDYHIKPEPVADKVFVYGTLKQGYGNHHILADSTFIGEGTSISYMVMIGKDYAFPYLLGYGYEYPSAKSHRIKGEIYEVDKATLKRLDRLEGYPTHYDKQTIYVTSADRTTHKCTVYIKADVSIYDLQEETLAEWTKSYGLQTFPPEPTTAALTYARQLVDMVDSDIDIYSSEALEAMSLKQLRETLDTYADALKYDTIVTHDGLHTREDYIMELEWLSDLLLMEYESCKADLAEGV
jgi:gamma-glutamylaminecyclotransferase